ncbi:hypothetical protein YC2023_116663 [Brassica napus]
MAERNWLVSLEDLPSHLILEVLTSGRLNAVDLLSLELTSEVFGGSSGLSHKYPVNAQISNRRTSRTNLLKPLESQTPASENFRNRNRCI